MDKSTALQQAEAVAGNLASQWNGGRSVLDRLVATAGDPAASPLQAARILGADGVEALFADDVEYQRLQAAFQKLTRYLTAETWFERAVRDDPRLTSLRESPVAYLCMEFGLANWLQIYSGGLGMLAGDMVKEASDLGLPFVAVGLMYRRGFFHQRLDESRYQTEFYQPLDPNTLGIERAVDRHGDDLVVAVPMGDRTISACVWKLQVGRVPLYLLDTDVAENERAEDREITAHLYGGDQSTRIQQEIVLGIGGARALRALDVEPSIYSMNEGHAAFLGLELLAGALEETDFSSALHRTRPRIVYTNHTVVAAGNDVFPYELVVRHLGAYAESRDIGVERLMGLATDPHGNFSMALLAFQMSGRANAVSELHARVIPSSWPGYDVEAVTNGVHAPTWLGPQIRALLDEYVPDWQSDEPSWEAIRSIPSDALRLARDAQRASMIGFVNRRQDEVRLDPQTLTLVWARRFAEYKRAFLMATDLERLGDLLDDPERPVQIVIAGKAHPRDEGGKQVLRQLLDRLRGDRRISPHVAFVPDYDEEIGRFLTMGADVWLNTPRKPLEASGTSGMKSSDNGGLQLTVRDGWADEVDWWDVGWGIAGSDDDADAQELYRFLEDGIVPTFYQRDANGVSEAWTARMKSTMIITLSRYSARRMLLDYLHKLYLPLLEEQSACSMV
ncbi:MAG: alpha-glucan family phosphorylase [Chloroflexota bacterium]|nr:alpha-glucan family phosphorylase [Chloroflexota bacterium]